MTGFTRKNPSIYLKTLRRKSIPCYSCAGVNTPRNKRIHARFTGPKIDPGHLLIPGMADVKNQARDLYNAITIIADHDCSVRMKRGNRNDGGEERIATIGY
jgi:hypothetical protein